MRTCGLCGREVARTSRHHLIPRTRHSNKRNKRDFSREEVRTRLVDLCRPCHNVIHHTFTEKQLEREYNTVEKLLAHPEIAKFVAWLKDKPDGTAVRFPRRGKGRG